MDWKQSVKAIFMSYLIGLIVFIVACLLFLAISIVTPTNLIEVLVMAILSFVPLLHGYICAKVSKINVFRHVTVLYFVNYISLVIFLDLLSEIRGNKMSTDVLVFGWISEVGLILFTYLGAIIWLRKNKLADMSKPWWDLNQYWSSGLQAQTVSSPLTQPIADQPTLPDTKHSPESNSQIDLNIHEL